MSNGKFNAIFLASIIMRYARGGNEKIFFFKGRKSGILWEWKTTSCEKNKKKSFIRDNSMEGKEKRERKIIKFVKGLMLQFVRSNSLQIDEIKFYLCQEQEKPHGKFIMLSRMLCLLLSWERKILFEKIGWQKSN